MELLSSNNPSSSQPPLGTQAISSPQLEKPQSLVIPQGPAYLSLHEDCAEFPTMVVARNENGEIFKQVDLVDFNPKRPKFRAKLWRRPLISLIRSLQKSGYGPIRHSNSIDVTFSPDPSHPFEGKEELLEALHRFRVEEVNN